MKKTLLFRYNYYRGLKAMSPEDRLEAYDAIMSYVFEDEVLEVSSAITPIMAMIYESIDNDIEKYEQVKNSRGWN